MQVGWMSFRTEGCNSLILHLPRSQFEYKGIMITALFWVVTQRVVVIYITDVSGQIIGPIFKGQELSLLGS